MKPNEIIKCLRDNLPSVGAGRKLRSFPKDRVMAKGFFPGGNGLYGTRSPIGGTLILGSNFGRYDDFVDAQGELVRLDETTTSRTWGGLLTSLAKSGIDAKQCFFTNAWPFLHDGTSNRGPVGAWLRDQQLMDSCVRFFECTFTAMQPRLIVALGTGPAAFLSNVWPTDLTSWGRRPRRIQNLDDLPMATVNFQGRTAVCVAITHPSMPNARHRRPLYRGFEGEVRLLAKARLKSER
jgi:hypothetical protein